MPPLDEPRTEPESLSFLAGGGEMGERTRAFDWAQTPLGPMARWPQSLRTALRIMLNSRFPMFVWWGRHLIKFYNDAYIPVLGKRHPAALGQPASRVWGEIWDTLGPQAEAVLSASRATWQEEQLLVMERNRFLEETYFTYSYSPIPDDAGGVGGVFCACTEDTQRVLGRRRLRTLRALAETASQEKTAQRACEVAASALAANPHDVPFALVYLLGDGGRRATLAGLTGLAPNTPASPAAVDLQEKGAPWPFRQVAATGAALVVDRLDERFGPLPGGVWPEPPHRAVVLPVARSGQSQLAGMIVVGLSPRLAFADDYQGFLNLLAGHVATAITNARAYEEERRRAEELAELDRAKTAFFSNVSHEFRTPLTLMLGPVEDVLAHPAGHEPPVSREALEVVRRNGLRLQRLVNTLLDFSRIEAGRVRAAYEPTDLAAFTADLASNFRSACEKAGLELAVDCPPLAEPVFVDRQMWEKVVLNLLSNAFKFTFEGGIVVSVRQAGRAAELRVRDTGTGIPAGEMPKLFERFHRVENARGRTHEGSGIGLALVHELVKLHGGSITAASEVGKGTAFTVTVPLGADHLPRERVGAGPPLAVATTGARSFVRDALRWLPTEQVAGDGWRGAGEDIGTLGSPAACHPPPATGARPRVLVADDNADMRQYLVRLLAGEYGVEAVPDGEAAVRAVRRQAPDLVLCDVMMPRLDGFALLKELRADPHTAGVPVILLSARAGEESRVEGMQAGADDYLVKPFGARELLARVSAHLQMARLRRDAQRVLRESELRYRLVGEAANDAIWDWDLVTNRVTWSEGVRRVFGYAEGQVGPEASWWIENVHPDDRGRVAHGIHGAIDGGEEQWRDEYRFRRADGSYADVLDRGRVVRDGGRPVRMVGSMLDLSERKRHDARVREQEQRTRTILESITDAFCGLDRDWRFTYVNRQAEVLLGRSREDLLGKNHWEEYPGTLGTDLERHYRRAVAENVTATFENYHAPHDRWYEMHAYPSPDGLSVYFRDVSERKRAEIALRDSEQRFRQLADAMPQIVWTARPDGNTDYYNRRWTEFTGLPQTVGNEAWGQILHPDDRPTANRRWAASLAAGAPFEMELRLLDRRRQSYRWHLVRTAAVPDGEGKVVRWFGTATDIDGQKRAEESSRFLAEASAALAAVVDYESTLQKVANLAVPYFADWSAVDVAEDGRLRRLAVAHQDPAKIDFVHRITREYPPDPRAPTGAYAVLRTGEPEFVSEITDDMLVQGAKDERHLALIRSLGLKSYLCVPLVVTGKTLGVLTFATAESGRRYSEVDLGLATDLAHRASVAVENTRLYQALRDADRRKDEFLATLAHELRNPLAPVRTSLQILSMPRVDPVTAERSRAMMERQVQHLVRLVDDLLDVSRVMRGKITLRTERVELATVVARAVETTQPVVEAQRHELTVSLPPDSLPLDADPVRLIQVVGNLLTNAAKYTDPGGRIVVTGEREGDAAILRVRDTGIGIAPDLLPKVFELFVQADHASTKAQGGLGIGLTLVRSLVEMHGGTVEARSEGLGRGSEFVVRLPLAASPDAAPGEEVARAAGSATAVPPRTRRLLVVDDNVDAAESLAELLRLLGHEVRVAHDGTGALALAGAYRPEVVFLDIGMPGMDGYEVARRLRRQFGPGDIRLAALTGWGQPEDRRRSQEAGFDLHLVKPVDPVVLERVLADLRPAAM